MSRAGCASVAPRWRSNATTTGLQALAEAHRLAGDRADILADYAEAEALLLGYRFQGKPRPAPGTRARDSSPDTRSRCGSRASPPCRVRARSLRSRGGDTLLAIVEAGSEQARMLEALVERTREENGRGGARSGGGRRTTIQDRCCW